MSSSWKKMSCIFKTLWKYAHPPTNSDYPSIFLRGWLALWKGHVMNWAQYVCITMQKQMKRARRPFIHSKENYAIAKFNSGIKEYTYFIQLNDGREDGHFIVEGPKEVKVFLANQIVTIKQLLRYVKSQEENFVPRLNIMQCEKEVLLNQVQYFLTNLLHKKK